MFSRNKILLIVILLVLILGLLIYLQLPRGKEVSQSQTIQVFSSPSSTPQKVTIPVSSVIPPANTILKPGQNQQFTITFLEPVSLNALNIQLALQNDVTGQRETTKIQPVLDDSNKKLIITSLD